MKEYIPVLWPSWRYHPTEAPRIVTEAQATALSDEWRDAPYPERHQATQASTSGAATGQDHDHERIASWYAASVDVLSGVISGVDDAEALAAQRLIEEARPDGARKTVLKMIDSRIGKLSKQAESIDEQG